MDMAASFQRVASFPLPPGGCRFCGQHRGGFDTGQDVDFEGRIYICVGCAEEMGRALGMASERDTTVLRERLDAAEANLKRETERGKALYEGVKGLRESGFFEVSQGAAADAVAETITSAKTIFEQAPGLVANKDKRAIQEGRAAEEATRDAVAQAYNQAEVPIVAKEQSEAEALADAKARHPELGDDPEQLAKVIKNEAKEGAKYEEAAIKAADKEAEIAQQIDVLDPSQGHSAQGMAEAAKEAAEKVDTAKGAIKDEAKAKKQAEAEAKKAERSTKKGASKK